MYVSIRTVCNESRICQNILIYLCFITKRTLYKSLQIHQDENIILFFFSLLLLLSWKSFWVYFLPQRSRNIYFALMFKIELVWDYNFKVMSFKTKQRLRTAVKTVHQMKINMRYFLFIGVLFCRISLTRLCFSFWSGLNISYIHLF